MLNDLPEKVHQKEVNEIANLSQNIVKDIKQTKVLRLGIKIR